MDIPFYFKHGNDENVNGLSLKVGEGGFTHDTGRFFIGDKDGNKVEFSKQKDMDNVNSQLSKKANQTDLDSVNTQLSENTQQILDIENINNIQEDFENLEIKSVTITYNPNDGIDERYYPRIKDNGLDVILGVMNSISSYTDANVVGSNIASLQVEIDKMKANNLKIQAIKPHIGINYSDGSSKGSINPTDVATFFTNWKNILLQYASLCNSNNIPILFIGNELSKLTVSANSNYWIDIVNTLRFQYPTLELSYSCVGLNEVDTLDYLWSSLDFISCNFYPKWYYTVYNSSLRYYDVTPYLSSYIFDNNSLFLRIKKYNKKFMISEIGVTPYADGLINLTTLTGTTKDYNVSALCYEALFNYLSQAEGGIKGFSIWCVGNPFDFFDLNSSESPAETIIKKYIKGGLI